MNTNFLCATLACLALTLSAPLNAQAAEAMKANTPIITKDVDNDLVTGPCLPPYLCVTDVDVVVVGYGTQEVVARGRTDANGVVIITTRKGKPGLYEIEIDGPSFVTAMDKLLPTAPEKKTGGSSLSLGVGGFLGGGSSPASSGNKGGPAQSAHGSSHSGGGVGLGANIPIGNGDNTDTDQPGYPITAINISLPANDSNKATGLFSTETPYCRETAIHGLKLLVAIKGDGTPIAMSIFDRWGNL